MVQLRDVTNALAPVMDVQPILSDFVRLESILMGPRPDVPEELRHVHAEYANVMRDIRAKLANFLTNIMAVHNNLSTVLDAIDATAQPV
ncbi:hypothetical protein WOLCODRAFT_150437 [Wolfiporia cocos MD-104 SS10]|uniref:Uncharacterized protein n=1 Tax=Wolfiporia cocos (strain MD-104) TaxID=742152 RepID=A0A2H3JDS6_WOLCO|nr:hypothetical protein WOLCODRAFT_150437 [Wolfiporia cocos MD-104 SS10]